LSIKLIFLCSFRCMQLRISALVSFCHWVLLQSRNRKIANRTRSPRNKTLSRIA
jgi:hypothetical protein